MKTIELQKATASLAEYSQDVTNGPLIVTKKGKPVAALVSIQQLDLEALSLGANPDFLAIIKRSRARQTAEGGLSSEEMRRRLGIKRARKAK